MATTTTPTTTKEPPALAADLAARRQRADARARELAREQAEIAALEAEEARRKRAAREREALAIIAEYPAARKAADAANAAAGARFKTAVAAGEWPAVLQTYYTWKRAEVAIVALVQEGHNRAVRNAPPGAAQELLEPRIPHTAFSAALDAAVNDVGVGMLDEEFARCKAEMDRRLGYARAGE